MSNFKVLRDIFNGAVKSVQPTTIINKQVKVLERHLWVNNQAFPLTKACYAVGFGKAVLGMALELERALGSHLERALVTVPKGIFHEEQSSKIDFIEGAKDNLPDKEAMEGALKIKHLVEELGEEDLLIVLISGGGSALLPLPRPPITLEEKCAIVKELSRSGATIQELNTVRQQLSLLKGGGLAKLAKPCRVVSLILSDVVNDPVDLIASGPTVEIGDKSADAIEILSRYNLYESAPISIRSVLNSPPESKSKDDQFENVANIIIGNNRIAVEESRKLALQNGLQCVIVSNKVEDTVENLSQAYSNLAQNILKGNLQKIQQILEQLPFKLEPEAIENVQGLCLNKPVLLIFAGEPTLKVTGQGKGGRNQQLALAVANKLERSNSGTVTFLSAGTDGVDGPTDAAGAIVSSELIYENAQNYLDDNDCYSFFEKFNNGNCFVKIGHTGTNVMDLHYLLIEPNVRRNS
ncbi:unnamed protein product [Ceutorhynchus assimilis]|uniref:Glycerate kinase n=1 Tax=Ceutorhynchus assimilis TaxID=467358 RepID=A0A9N9MMN3_9CUCU|nr:unnamed protein product [Ceutorhynchus assimilis]